MPAQGALEEGTRMTESRKTEIVLLALLVIEAVILTLRFT